LFFVLSKTIGTMLLPTNFLIGLGLLGTILLATRFASLGRKLAAASIVLLAIAGFTPLGNLLLYPLESRFPPWDPARGAPDGIIILGGSIDEEISAAHGMPVIRGAADRLVTAVTLARAYPDARIVFTGGSGNLIRNEQREADYASELLQSLGIPKARLTIERDSRNTYENAQFTKAIAAPKNGQRWLLVTSASHMPRSVGLFRKAGFEVEPYPVDWRVGTWSDVYEFTNVAGNGWSRTDAGLREWMGLLSYRITGKSSELFPRPLPD
jgi:uncharacterized SAM-binding protein YcdF (DUF218 family)